MLFRRTVRPMWIFSRKNKLEQKFDGFLKTKFRMWKNTDFVEDISATIATWLFTKLGEKKNWEKLFNCGTRSLFFLHKNEYLPVNSQLLSKWSNGKKNFNRPEITRRPEAITMCVYVCRMCLVFCFVFQLSVRIAVNSVLLPRIYGINTMVINVSLSHQRSQQWNWH